MARFVRFRDGDTPRFGIVKGAELTVIDPHPFGPWEKSQGTRSLEGLQLLAPVVPTKVVCVGKNYSAHAEELGGEVPAEPLIFLKPSTAIIGPNDPVRCPPQSAEVHHEAELAVIIKGLLRDATPEEALAGVAGYTCANDVTARDLQRHDDQWTRAKGFDSFLPLGPAMSTDIDPTNLKIRCYVDGELRQDGNTSDQVWPVGELLSYISKIMTLLPTDVVLTGTPAGVGPIKPGQTVEVEIDHIGRLVNPVVAR